MKEVIGDYDAFVHSINQAFDRIGIDTSELVMCDHLCYRVESEARYREMKESLAVVAQNIGEVPVSGRLISTFEFAQPLEVGGWRIPCIELPAPKEGAPCSEGLEHAEFVVVGSLESFQRRYSSLPFSDKAMGKQINPELGLKMPEHGLSVKFHEIALGAVVRLERRLNMV